MLAALKPLIFLDFSKSYNSTRTTEHLLEEAGALFFCICFPNQRPPAPKARFNPPLPGGQAQPALPLVRIQSLGPNHDDPNYMIQVDNLFGFKNYKGKEDKI